MVARLQIPPDRLAAFCERHGIRRLSIFGSALREDFTPESDLDVLVEFEPDVRVGFFSFIAIQDELSALLGREVDLNTPGSLSRHFRQDVMERAEVLYGPA